MLTPTCHRLLANLSAFLDGELPPEAAAEAEAHLAVCTECRSVADTFRKTMELYRAAPQPALSPQGRERLYKRLDLGDFIEPSK